MSKYNYCVESHLFWAGSSGIIPCVKLAVCMLYFLHFLIFHLISSPYFWTHLLFPSRHLLLSFLNFMRNTPPLRTILILAHSVFCCWNFILFHSWCWVTWSNSIFSYALHPWINCYLDARDILCLLNSSRSEMITTVEISFSTHSFTHFWSFCSVEAILVPQSSFCQYRDLFTVC